MIPRIFKARLWRDLFFIWRKSSPEDFRKARHRACRSALLAPDVVDVSSGVEQAPGVKSPAEMRNFVRAVAQAQVTT